MKKMLTRHKLILLVVILGIAIGSFALYRFYAQSAGMFAQRSDDAEFWANGEESLLLPETKVLADDDPLVLEHKANLQMLYGEIWHNDVYDKDAIEMPEVKAEETVEGELWFPPINNTASLEEIAPTISYELMLEGYYISSYYPDNPEDYTAQALNENAFPIAFFRKINDLVYYTVCKVEGGGYMYYFFMAKSGVTDEQVGITENRGDNLCPFMYDPQYTDLDSMDLTKEVIWRGSIYSEENIGDWLTFQQHGTNDTTLEEFCEFDSATRATADLLSRLQENVSKDSALTTEQRNKLLNDMSIKVQNSGAHYVCSKHLCTDGIVKKLYFCDISGWENNYKQWTMAGGSITTSTALFIYSQFAGERMTEENSVLMKILPIDYIS